MTTPDGSRGGTSGKTKSRGVGGGQRKRNKVEKPTLKKCYRLQHVVLRSLIGGGGCVIHLSGAEVCFPSVCSTETRRHGRAFTDF